MKRQFDANPDCQFEAVRAAVALFESPRILSLAEAQFDILFLP